jgi:hypothetical protein
LAIKDSRTYNVRELMQKMDVLLELVVDLQASSARGAAQMALAMCLAHTPTVSIDVTTTGIPLDADPNQLLDACSGYDTRIARRIRHDEFYDKVVLPADEPLEAELEKEREAEARPSGSGDGSWYTRTSSKEAEKNKTKSDDEDASSPAKEAEKSEAQAEDEDPSSPVKEK